MGEEGEAAAMTVGGLVQTRTLSGILTLGKTTTSFMVVMLARAERK